MAVRALKHHHSTSFEAVVPYMEFEPWSLLWGRGGTVVARVTSHCEIAGSTLGSASSPTPIGRGKARYKLDQERGPQNHSERTSLETPGDTRWDLDTSKPSEASWWSQLCRCHSDRPSDGINGCERAQPYLT